MDELITKPVDQAQNDHLEKLRAIRRSNLFHLQEEAARYGSNPPIALVNQINEEKAAIATIEQSLLDPTPYSVLTDIGVVAQVQGVNKSIYDMATAWRKYIADESTARIERQREVDHRAALEQAAREQRQRDVDRRDDERDRQIAALLTHQVGQGQTQHRQLAVQTAIAILLFFLLLAVIIGLSVYFARG